MKTFNLIFGFLLVVIFTCGVTGSDLHGIFEKNLTDIKNNFALSIAILVFTSLSLICILFLKESLDYPAGILCGLGIATLLTGFQYSIGLSIIAYSALLRDTSMKTHNKVKN